MTEIEGIIKNGIDRGDNIQRIKESLLNSGYASSEIEYELGKFSEKSQPKTEMQAPEIPIDSTATGFQKLDSYKITQVEKKPTKTKTVVLLIILLLCLTTAGILFFLM